MDILKRAARVCRVEVGPCYWKTDLGQEYFFREPNLSDGAGLWTMARDSTLDLNSPYAYLMLAGHFADTCVVAENRRKPVGFVSAFLRPAAPDSVFVWQIAVAPFHRGQGLARKLLHQLLARPACRRVRMLEANVTRSNRASRALFRGLAQDFGTKFRLGGALHADLFPGGSHEAEDLVRVGPLPPQRRKPAALPYPPLTAKDESYAPSNDEYGTGASGVDRVQRYRRA